MGVGSRPKLTASDGNANQIFGYSVAIGGNKALVGAPGNSPGFGFAYLFDAGTGQELFKLAPADQYSNLGYAFGISVAMSGNTAIIGASHDNGVGTESGAAYVFDVTTGQQLFKLTASDASEGAAFGGSVAISDNVAIVGAPGDAHAGIESGSAYLFDVITGREIGKLTAGDAAQGSQFGASVAISGDLAVIGSPRSDEAGMLSSGSAYLFDVQTREQLMKFIASDAGEHGDFGRSISISGDDVFVGAPGAADYGASYLFAVVPEPSATVAFLAVGLPLLTRRRGRITSLKPGESAST